ncbi:MAG: type II toxin-antitoxin system VapC family toxin [Candidatus Heimdallarchaeota archaeon]
MAPQLFVFDVSNALRYNPDFREKDVVEAVGSLLGLQIDLRSPQKVWMKKSIEIAFKMKITLYDSVYIGLADALGVPVITADKRLIKLVKYPNLVHISDVGGPRGI